MNILKINTLGLLIIFSATIFSCKKKDDVVNPTPTTTDTTTVGEIGFEITNYAGSKELVLNTESYINANNDTFTVSMFQYYISNIVLKKADGTTYTEPESYHLVKADAGSSRHFHLKNVPKGTYTSVSFLIGVDAARNTSGAQTGALDPANGMFWSWSTGYIMAKVEGTSNKVASSSKKFVHHIGGFEGANSALRTVTFDLSATPLILAGGKESAVLVKADILKWFSPNIISIGATSTVMTISATSKSIADNYANMFSVTAVENE